MTARSSGERPMKKQNATDAPASKEDIQRYLNVMHCREMLAQSVEAMIKPMRQMTHERY